MTINCGDDALHEKTPSLPLRTKRYDEIVAAHDSTFLDKLAFSTGSFVLQSESRLLRRQDISSPYCNLSTVDQWQYEEAVQLGKVLESMSVEVSYILGNISYIYCWCSRKRPYNLPQRRKW